MKKKKIIVNASINLMKNVYDVDEDDGDDDDDHADG